MPAKEKEYRRLPGLGRRTGISVIGEASRIWLGKNHLLVVDGTGYSERYKRFFFHDIQAFTVQRTERRRAWNIVFGVLTGLWLGLSIFAIYEHEKGFGIFFATLAFFSVLVLVINTLRGPTCISHIYTAVQKDELPSLHRLRTLTKVLGIISPLIQDGQKELKVELNNPEQALAEEHVSTRTDGKSPITSPPLEFFKPYEGKIHASLFYLLLVQTVIITIDIFREGMGITILDVVVVITVGVLTILALLKQRQSGIKGELVWMTWGTLGYLVTCYLLATVWYVVSLMKFPGWQENPQSWMIRRIFYHSVLGSPMLTACYTFSVIGSLYLGTFGLVSLRKFKKEKKVPPPVPEILSDMEGNPRVTKNGYF